MEPRRCGNHEEHLGAQRQLSKQVHVGDNGLGRLKPDPSAGLRLNLGWHRPDNPSDMSANALALDDYTPAQVACVSPTDSVAEVAAETAHELRNALAAITHQVELLQLETPASTASRTELILKTVDSAANVLRRLQEATVPAAAQREPVDLRQILVDVAELTRFRWERLAGDPRPPIKVHLEVCDVPPVLGNAGEFMQVFTNLVINACEALGPDGGNVHLRTHYDGGHVLAAVADDGPGMSSATRASLFDRRFTTKRGDNSGLGLSIVADIVRRHRGHVLVHSHPNRGSIFYVSLHPQPTCGKLKRMRSPVRVLLVEDEPTIRECLRELLERAGHEVRTASNGEEAIQALTRDVEVLLTDYNLGGMDGLEVARQARRLRGGIKTIMLTGRHEAELALQEVDLLLRKPTGGSELLRAVEQVMQQPGPTPRRPLRPLFDRAAAT